MGDVCGAYGVGGSVVRRGRTKFQGMGSLSFLVFITSKCLKKIGVRGLILWVHFRYVDCSKNFMISGAILV